MLCELSVEAFLPLPTSDAYKLLTEQLTASYVTHAVWEKQGFGFFAPTFLKIGRSYLKEKTWETFDLRKVVQSASLLAFGGPTTDYIDVSMSELEKPIPTSNIKVGHTLCNTPGALEILLMLADVFTATPNELIGPAADEENLLEAIAELRRCELLVIQGKTISLTEPGLLVVKKLRALLLQK